MDNRDKPICADDIEKYFKNNLVKIAFETADNLALGGFVIIEDTNNPYVAQVMNLKSD